MKKKEKRHTEKKLNLELRPHHVLGFAEHETQPKFYDSHNEEYISRFRDARKKEWGFKDTWHSDEIILHWRDTIKKLHKNPSLKFKYVSGLDSVCKKCDKSKLCSNKKHWAYKSAQEADAHATNYMPELKFGKIYDGYYLRELFKKKGWIKKEK